MYHGQGSLSWEIQTSLTSENPINPSCQQTKEKT